MIYILSESKDFLINFFSSDVFYGLKSLEKNEKISNKNNLD